MEILKKKIKLITKIVLLLTIIGNGIVFSSEPVEKYEIRNITFTGNVRIGENQIRPMIAVKEGNRVSIKSLEFKLKVSLAKMEASKLFMFIETYYEKHEDGTIDIQFLIGENIMFLELIALEEGSFTRFSSISESAPDFGFLIGATDQILYFRFPELFHGPLNLITTIGHQAYSIPFDSTNLYDYEAVLGKLALELTILPNWKIKTPNIFRYNLNGDAKTAATYDVSTGLETLVDFSHYKDVIYTGFNLRGGIYQGLGEFSYTISSVGMNLFFKPLPWEEIILRGRYNSLIAGNLPDYLLYRIDNEYQVRGGVSNYYYGNQSLMLNIENWFHDIFTVPTALTDLKFSLLMFADFGTAGDSIRPIQQDTWNFAVGGAISIKFEAPLNIVLQLGYGQEIWQNTGGKFFVKMGYEFHKGNFYE
ncbi:MAG: hypothetical protein ABUK01_03720 [Leptospirales bacterium]